MFYSLNLQELLKEWHLQALQDLANAGHRLRFDEDVTAHIEAAFMSKLDKVGDGELVPLLLWAHSISSVQLQATLAVLAAKRATMASLKQAFGGQQPLFAIIRALRPDHDSGDSSSDNKSCGR